MKYFDGSLIGIGNRIALEFPGATITQTKEDTAVAGRVTTKYSIATSGGSSQWITSGQHIYFTGVPEGTYGNISIGTSNYFNKRLNVEGDFIMGDPEYAADGTTYEYDWGTETFKYNYAKISFMRDSIFGDERIFINGQTGNTLWSNFYIDPKKPTNVQGTINYGQGSNFYAGDDIYGYSVVIYSIYNDGNNDYRSYDGTVFSLIPDVTYQYFTITFTWDADPRAVGYIVEFYESDSEISPFTGDANFIVVNTNSITVVGNDTVTGQVVSDAYPLTTTRTDASIYIDTGTTSLNPASGRDVIIKGSLTLIRDENNQGRLKVPYLETETINLSGNMYASSFYASSAQGFYMSLNGLGYGMKANYWDASISKYRGIDIVAGGGIYGELSILTPEGSSYLAECDLVSYTNFTKVGFSNGNSSPTYTWALGWGSGGNVVLYNRVDCQSTSQPLIVPRLTTTARDALNPIAGSIIYNTTDLKFQGYENGGWRNLI